ncbi:MAG: hypothetical protein LBV70_07480 [Candidatus Adiutrix sp.]|jgi:hypothetical protein|nr:hypothetical protein [Candidatus Adiutrix sp.]
MSKARHIGPVEAKRLLLPGRKIDLVLALDNLSGSADIRQSMVLDLRGDQVIVAQTDPPLLRSQLGRRLEVSFVHRDIVTSEIIRWAWTASVLRLDNNYLLNPDEPKPVAVPVIGLSLPESSVLVRSNIRQAYRLDTTKHEGIVITIHPMPAPVRLINFSVDGLMMATAAPSPYAIGQELHFKLDFPAGDDLPVYRIEGQAKIVRQELNERKRTVSLGLRFQFLMSEAKWALPKILNYYMLEEQRRRRSLVEV